VDQKEALAALIFADFNSKRHKNTVFDWDVILNPDGDTGPYVMYTFARASSILRKAGHMTNEAWYPLESDEEQMLIQTLEDFPKIIQISLSTFEPSSIANYLIDLSKLFNRFYQKHQVIQKDLNLQSSRLKLVKATTIVLMSGLSLLGLKPVEEL